MNYINKSACGFIDLKSIFKRLGALIVTLWVAKAFVPDMFTVIVVSASLLFISGIARVLFRIKKMAAEKTLNKECNFFGR